MIARRRVLGGLLGALASAACSVTRPTPEPATPGPPPLALDPVVDLVPAARLQWLVDARPRELLASPILGAVLAAVATDEQLETFARRHGGVDLRRAEEVAVAGHGGGTLSLARLVIEPARVEAAFTARARVVEGRAVERGVTRFWGTVGDEREQVAVFGHDAVGLERGTLGPLQAAEYFAQGRLKRAAPALRAEPLASAAARLGDFPLRGFAPGPFEEAWAAGLGGLLGASTALAAGLRADPDAGAGASGAAGASAVTGQSAPALALRVVLLGAWGDDAGAAAERLRAAFRVLGEDPLGRLAGLDRPVSEPVTSASADALALDVGLDPVRMIAGLRAATGAPLAEIMAF